MMSITLPRSKTAHGLAYSQSGEGVPVVLIHGVGLRAECWYQQIDALKDDYSVFALDMPGHGESDLLDGKNPTLGDFTKKIAQFIEEVVQQPAVIVGHSMGALIALSLAIEYPELCLAIVPMNAIYKRSDEAKKAVLERASQLNTLSHADACAPIARWFGDSSESDGILNEKDDLHAQLCRDCLSQADLEGYATAYKVFAKEDGPATTAINDLTLPVLYLTGELDLNSNQFMSKAMANKTTDAECVIIKQSRHMTPLTHAVEVNEALINFLQRRITNTESK